jgi:hypothetical protein
MHVLYRPIPHPTIKRLENLQHQMARSILKAARNTPIAALLGDLGWCPIQDIHNQRKVKYFSRLLDLDLHRWPKLLLNALMTFYNNDTTLRYKWLNCINNSLVNCGLDHAFSVQNHSSNRSWFKSFHHIYRNQYNIDWYSAACSKSSLNSYVLLKRQPNLENYLLDNKDFYGASLKFKARSNTLPLNGRTRAWEPNNSGLCQLCNDGIEDLKHFMFTCENLHDVRTDELAILKRRLTDSGLLFIWYIIMLKNYDTNLYLILGGDCNEIMPMLSKNLTKLAHKIVDDYCKSYLKKAWRNRNDKNQSQH